MDEIKDIQAKSFSKFLDVDVKTNPFGSNRSAEKVYRKSERLVAAIFLLTNHIAQEESIRNETRGIAMSLLPAVLRMRDQMRAISSIEVSNFYSIVRRLISQVKILVFGGFISQQNAEIISSAIDELGNFMNMAQKSNLSESFNLSKEDILGESHSYKGHIKDIKDISNIKDRLLIKDMHATGGADSPLIGVTSRSMSILDILKRNGNLNIRDIAAHLPEYSEKSIQRELVLLISQGLIKRIGAKRWSRYEIAKSTI